MKQAGIAVLGALLAATIALSCWASHLSLVYLPAADVWQHTALIEQAASGHIDAGSLLQKHNGLHFIPVPKLVYALDVALFAGSGVFTAGISALFTALSGVAFARLVLNIYGISNTEKWALILLTGSWLVCILQWESFVNPANLQWSGLNAGLVLTALGMRRCKWFMACGGILAIGCGAPWWLLLLAIAAVQVPYTLLLRSVAITLGAGLLWDSVNGYGVHALPPLPVIALHTAMPLRSDELATLGTLFFNGPLAFYRDWFGNLLPFIGSFCLPGLERLLPTAAMIWLSPLPLLAYAFLMREQNENARPFRFLLTATLLTCLAAGMTRAQLPGAYTLRFANTGLLFASAAFVLAQFFFGQGQNRKACWIIALLFSALLATACLREAASIVHGSNQRRLSQVAYALDIHDARATSETPFAPLMELSYREISERKGVLETHAIGIYHSREHRVFTGTESLPSATTTCVYEDIAVKPLRDDNAARKVTGQTRNAAGDDMTHTLLRDSSGRAIGYGIMQVNGSTVAAQLLGPRRWAGFLHPPTDGAVDIIAYNRQQQCQPFRVMVP